MVAFQAKPDLPRRRAILLESLTLVFKKFESPGFEVH